MALLGAGSIDTRRMSPYDVRMSTASSSRIWRLVGAVLLLGVALLLGYRVGRARTSSAHLPDATIAVADTSTVVTAIRGLARLESVAYHMERIIDLTEHQQHLFGLIQANDQILLVAVGDVIAGVDLAKLGASDVNIDAQHDRVRIRLPAPEILSVRLDNERTYVHSRKSDLLAKPDIQMESKARQQAEESIRDAALAAHILDRARQSTELTVSALARSLGHREAEVLWPGPLMPAQ